MDFNVCVLLCLVKYSCESICLCKFSTSTERCNNDFIILNVKENYIWHDHITNSDAYYSVTEILIFSPVFSSETWMLLPW